MNAPLNINMHSAPHMHTLTHTHVQARTVVATKVMTMQKRARIRAILHFSKPTLFPVGQSCFLAVTKSTTENVVRLIFIPLCFVLARIHYLNLKSK